VNKEFNDRTKKLDSELHGTQQDQRGPMSTATMVGSLPLAPFIGRYGGASSDLSPILDLTSRELARKHTALDNIDFSEAKAMSKQKLARKWGHVTCLAYFTPRF